jgi:hypothetical protein
MHAKIPAMFSVPRLLMPGLTLAAFFSLSSPSPAADPPLLTGDFKWTVSAPLVSPAVRENDPCDAVKDPTIVFHEGRWHLFTTIRSKKRTHQIEYLSFTDWKEANAAPRHILTFNSGYFCAPQVFYFTPHRKWYLLHQMSDPCRKPSLQPAVSTSEKLSDPGAWSKGQMLFKEQPKSVTAWIDFWIICDDAKAHLFFTSNNGLMWRSETTLASFPGGWSEPAIVLRDDIFEASHTYKLKGRNRYLTVVEAEAKDGSRYYKAYTADRLDGEWKPLAATAEKPFASRANVKAAAAHWTDSISHGEMLRTGIDERMEIDPDKLQFLFQGVSDSARAGRKYGEIPWQLGLLELRR